MHEFSSSLFARHHNFLRFPLRLVYEPLTFGLDLFSRLLGATLRFCFQILLDVPSLCHINASELLSSVISNREWIGKVPDRASPERLAVKRVVREG
jgi:hypothetical protein